MLPRRGPHVFVADVAAPELAPDDRHHLERVLRVRDGDFLTLSDGAGRWREAAYGSPMTLIGDVHQVAPPRRPITVAFALVKGGRPELVVQKLTELGVDRIIPFTAERSVVRWDDAKAAKNLTRLRRVAREAAMQSKRVWLPEVGPIAGFGDVVALDGAVMADLDAPPWVADESTTVLIGPEGGWSDTELASGLPRRQMLPTVLRAETAAIAAGVLLATAS